MTQVSKNDHTLLIYGAAGFTGTLISHEAVKRGLKFEIAGRNYEEVSTLAKELNVPFHVFEVDDEMGWKKSLFGKTSLLNVAGPFSATANQAMNASIKHKVHYIDTNAEVDVYRLAEAKDEDAKTTGIMIMSGAGLFVSFDPLAVHTAKRVNNPVRLRLAYKYSGGFTPGSLASSANIINAGLLVRREGELVKLESAEPGIFDYGEGLQEYALMPLGGSVLTYKSTRVKNIEEYFQMAQPGAVQQSDQSIQPKDKSILLAEITDADGTIVRSKIETEPGYELTVSSAIEIASRTLNGLFKAGFQSPAAAYGEDLIYSLPNLEIIDL